MDKLREILAIWVIFFAVLLLFIPLMISYPVSFSQGTPAVNNNRGVQEQNNVSMPKAKGVFIEGSYGGDAETLNLLLASDGTSFSYIGHTMDSLANYNNKLDIHLLCLAKDIEVSTDGLTY